MRRARVQSGPNHQNLRLCQGLFGPNMDNTLFRVECGGFGERMKVTKCNSERKKFQRKMRGQPPVVYNIMNEYETRPEKTRRYRAGRRERAIKKLSQGNEPACIICGCPHSEILQFGHPKHRGGRWHRRELGGSNYASRSVIAWVLRTPIEEVIELVQLECPFCNSWHNRFKEYPPPEKQPQWRNER